MAKIGRPRKSENDFDYDRGGWYGLHAWSDTRDAVLQHRGAVCARCGAVDGRFEVHHLEDPFPTRDVGLLLSSENLTVLCAACHRVHHLDQGANTVCEVCGIVVEHNPYQLGKRRFCSLACRDRHPDFAPRVLDARVCPTCEAAFTPSRPEQVHCGQVCAATSTAAKRRAARPTFTCSCGKVFSLPPSQAARARASAPRCSKTCPR